MIVVVRAACGVLVLAHGLVHLLYLAPDVREFNVASSWAVPEPARRRFGLVMVSATVAAFALLALAMWGFPVLSPAWPALAITAAGLSLCLLLAYWNNWLVLGVVIDVAVLVVAMTRPHWIDR